MEQYFTDNAWDDYLYWQKHDKKILKKINTLIRDIQTFNPYEGIGKPEPLKHNLTGSWSRRINNEHRLVYCIKDSKLIIQACRYHYRSNSN